MDTNYIYIFCMELKAFHLHTSITMKGNRFYHLNCYNIKNRFVEARLNSSDLSQEIGATIENILGNWEEEEVA